VVHARVIYNPLTLKNHEQRSPVCPQMCENITEEFKNNVPYRKIGRDLHISVVFAGRMGQNNSWNS